MRTFLSILFLLFTSIITAQKKAEPLVAAKAINSKFQFVDKQTGVPVNDQLWDETDPFVNGYARVLLNDRFSFVNGNGKLINPVVFEAARNFSNNLAAVKKGEKWGFINETGKMLFPFSYNIVFDFEGAVTAVFDNKKWWLINNKGDIIKPLDISVFYGFKNGVAKVTRDESEGIMDTNGKITLYPKTSISSKPISYHPNSNNATEPCPDNIDFENGSFLNWQCYIGQVDSVGNTNVITVNPSPPTNNRHTLVPRVTPSLIDPYGLFPTNPPDGSGFAVKLGNTVIGAKAERIRYTIRVPLNDTNFSINYNYAVVFEDPGHTIWTQPRFISKLLDSATNTYIDCASFEYISVSGLPGFAISPTDPNVLYKPWSSVFYNLRGYGGKTLYLEFTTADCVRRGHWGYAYLDVESTCGDAVQVNYDCTYPNITTLTGPPGFQFYNWWNDNYTTLLGTGQQIVLNPGPSVNSIIWLEMTPYNNFGCKDTLMVNITGALNAQFAMSDTTTCGAPHSITFYNRNLPSLTTLWDFGDGTTGTGDTVTHTFYLPGSYNVKLTVTVLGGCNGTATNQVKINPIPSVLQPASQVLCSGTTATATSFTGSVTGTLFNWTNSNPSIGLAAVGSGNIPAFTAVNVTNAPVTATISVTPFTLNCPGNPQTFTITVNPTANVVQPPNQALCRGTVTNPITFTGAVNGTAFNWTNSNTAIGLAANGIGNIPAFTSLNSTGVPIIATITVTPSAFGCTGNPKIFTLTVNPTPDVVQSPNQTLCSGTATNAITFTGTVNGTAFNWTNSNPAIGLAANGIGNILSFATINTTGVPIIATITVTPSAFGCTGTPKIFTLTVNPTPDVVQSPNQTLCSGTATNAITFTGTVNGTAFNWTNSNPAIGLAANGIGNIPSFATINTTGVPIIATITVTPSAFGCTGNPKIFTLTVNPTPDVVQSPDQTLCSGTATNTITFTGSVNGTAFNWTNSNPAIGLAANGIGNIPSFATINTTGVPIIATITVTPSAFGCTGTPKIFTLTVNPTPDVIQSPDQTLCSGTTINAITFTGAVNGTAFNWTNSNTAIGLAANGIGNIPAFTSLNSTGVPIIATITVTPSAFGCTGNPKIFTLTVNPTPDVVKPPNQTLCNGNVSNAIIFTGSINGTVYNWINTAPSIGLPASGTGNIAPFTAFSNGLSTSVATITVVPTAFGCTGPLERFTITINPAPNVIQPPDQTLCNGATTNLISFTGSLNNLATYNWTNSNPSIGLASTGTGNITSFTAINTGSTPITATITVTPSTNLCPGLSKTFTITIHPTPSVVAGNSTNVCLGNTAQLSATGASQYFWSPATGLSCTNCPNPVATPVDSIRYIVRGASAFGCENFDSVILTVSKPFQMLITPNDTLCIGESTVLAASGANSYIWSPPAGLNRTDIAAPTARPNTSTQYRVVGYDGHNCFTDTSFVMITVGPKPTLYIGPDLTLSTGSVVPLNPVTQNGPIINWAWTPSAGLSCTTCPAPTLTVKDNSYYVLSVTNNYGCITNDTIFIFVFCKSAQVFIPNAFTPDGDGLNDILMVRGKGIFVKTFRIFSRWGELVFEKTNFNPNDLKYGWDGKVRGIPATPDVFVYTADVICDNGIIYTYKGNTTLLK